MSQDGARLRQVVGYTLRAAIGLGLLALALHMNRDEIRGVLERRPSPAGFALGSVFYLGGLMFAYLRWYLLVRAIGIPFRYRDAVRLGFIGALFNFVIPGAIFGNVVKAAFLCRERPEDKPRAIGSVVVDFLTGLIGLFLIAAVVGTVGLSRLDPRVKGLVGAAWLAVGLSALALGLAFRPRRSRRTKRRGDASAFRDHPLLIVVAIAMGAGTHSLNVLAFHAVSLAMFGTSQVPGLAAHFLIVPLVLFTTAVPLPFGALGVAEGASQGLFGLMHYHGGAVAMLGFRVVTIVGASIGAVVYLLNAREVRALAEEASEAEEQNS